MARIVRFLLVLMIPLAIMRPVYSGIDSLSLGLGLIDENVLNYQTDVDGNRNLFEFRVLVEAQLYYDLFDDNTWYLIPAAAAQFPQSTEESAITKYRYYFGANLGHKFEVSTKAQLMVRAGSALYFTHLASDGGSSTLPNGTSTTDFPLPPESTTAINLTANLGAELMIEDLSFKAEALVFNPADSLKRALTYTLTVHYHFKDLL